MAVSFSNIPGGIRVPLFYAELDSSMAGTSVTETRILCVGQIMDGTPAATGEPIPVMSKEEAAILFGAGSQLHKMIEAALKNNGGTIAVWGLPMASPEGGKAAATLTFDGEATKAGSVFVYLNGSRYVIPVQVGDTAEAVATNVKSILDGDMSSGITVARNENVLTLTAKYNGEVTNQMTLTLNHFGAVVGEVLPQGIACNVVSFEGGTGLPALELDIANLGDLEFDVIASGINDVVSLGYFTEEMNDISGRWSPLRQVYGHVIAAMDNTVPNLTSAVSTMNDQHLSIVGLRKSPTPAFVVAAAAAAACAKSASIDPARPVQTLPLVGVLPPKDIHAMTTLERNTLLYSGVATVYSSGGYVRIERMVTTYRKNSAEVSDTAYLDAETLWTLQYILRNLRGRILTKYSRHKLANDGTAYGPGQAIVTPSVIRGELVAAYRDFEDIALVENADVFVENLIVERNASDPCRIDVLFPPDLVNQLRVFALLAQFRLEG